MNITATAHRWDHGWELWLNDEAATQVTTLDNAVEQVRDYLDTVDPDTDHSDWEITIEPAIGDLADAVRAARSATVHASEATVEAAAKSRAVARQLRDAGFSVTDSAAILGVSRGRVSQLVKT
ncbi:antitoxin HicB [Gordonia sp. X0973]|uniref:antitoxin HicB n=1 Tax=Gordonia sp. X0973 TaxID=2742602 RepID=UPI000F535621|nr:antitoxin HicB [Gordonia sp. X0973]QKT08417.1 antitoxin HicB [Gordonia sp. X0973]